MDDVRLKEIFLKGNYVSPEDLAKAEEYAKAHHASLVDYLITEGLMTKDLLGQAIAESFGVPYADLNSNQPSTEQVLKIPEEIAIKFRVVLFKEEEKKVVITTDNPFGLIGGDTPPLTPPRKGGETAPPLTPPRKGGETATISSPARGEVRRGGSGKVGGILPELQKFFLGKEITVAYSLPEDIDATFIHYRKPLETRFSEIIKKQKLVAPSLIDEIIDDALAFRASDVHFEPQEKDVVVRFRVDGVLREAGRIPKDQYDNILNRIKVSSHMRIDEHFAAQDGAMRYAKKDAVVDMRVSVMPTLDGEKVAMRLLAQYVRAFTLGDLGLSAGHQVRLEAAVKKPFGMILVTGPTGSGKTTTLYALVKYLNRPEINITTIEDPVEYKLIGINQIQVNPLTNLTYAKGLKSILRQDPNIILVGEVRDQETAEIAVNAALTGHLLFSTFHANDAATAIPRLLDMGIEPFLMASTLELIIAQRLIRKICEHCRHSYTPSNSPSERGRNDAVSPPARGGVRGGGSENLRLYKGRGCEACHNSGYAGRTAIYEFLEITPEMEALILKHPSTSEIGALARKQGARSMYEDGMEKVKSGVTTMEELLRVAQPPTE